MAVTSVYNNFVLGEFKDISLISHLQWPKMKKDTISGF